MMQSQIFAEMWTNLGQEEKVSVNEKNNTMAKDEDAPFVFNLPTITANCLHRIVQWMRHKHGQPEFELKLGQETGQVCNKMKIKNIGKIWEKSSLSSIRTLRLLENGIVVATTKTILLNLVPKTIGLKWKNKLKKEEEEKGFFFIVLGLCKKIFKKSSGPPQTKILFMGLPCQ